MVGNSTVPSGSGNDTIHSGLGTDYIYANDGDDVIVSLNGVAEMVDGGKGRDTVTADADDILSAIERVN